MKNCKNRLVSLFIASILIAGVFINNAYAKSSSLTLDDYNGYYVNVNYIEHHNEPGYHPTETTHMDIDINSTDGMTVTGWAGFGNGGAHILPVYYENGSFENGKLYTSYYFSKDKHEYSYSPTTELLTIKKGKIIVAVYRRVDPFVDDYIDAGLTHVYTYPEGRYDIGNKPSQTILSSVKSGKNKKLTVKWKRNSTGSGYQIQYSTDKVFKKGNKTVTVSGNKKTTKTIKGLKKKKYYIRIRTYRVKYGKKYYSGWSKIKRVKIK